MKKILIEDFEKHGFKADIEKHCENEEMLVVISKKACLFKVYMDENGQYIRLCNLNIALYADEADDFKEFLGKLADKIGHASIVYRQRSVLARIASDELRKEIEK